MSTVLVMVLGLVGLVIGAELLVRGGSGVAVRLGIAPITIGLTVVALGTSMPELAIGVDAARRGSGGLAVGNIVGTNLVNLLLILGLSAAIRPIALATRTLRFDLPAMTAAALVVFVMGSDGTLTTVEGAVLLVLGVAYTYGVLRAGRADAAERTPEGAGGATTEGSPSGGLARDVIGLVAGLVVIVVGADLLVSGAVDAASSLGISDAVIGLTVIAIGTSAPELVTTLVSTFRGDRELALGNLIGSSVYNLVFILGVTAIAAPESVPVPDEVLAADLVLMAVVAVACVPVFMTGRRISRIEGGVFVAAYVVYLSWLVAVRA
ncbi:calcium/sodium antiporter [Mumia zhuanghuii]|uniref:Calcium/sodium antiporter n=2 Tax=Mumia TaxID=1546255 RepID=A0ABW1QPM6_9ACTN|nr:MULTISPECIES: calcium/sodium antiporter [Mumia]KAA1423901.1 calcium/sodium antiporter [Mumia zhuanghuii]